jgi:hypothetical protein
MRSTFSTRRTVNDFIALSCFLSEAVESLAAYLEKFAQDWLAAAGIRCRLDLPLQFPE